MYNFNFNLDAEDHQNFHDILNHEVVNILLMLTDESLSSVQKDWIKRHLQYTKNLIAKIEASAKYTP